MVKLKNDGGSIMEFLNKLEEMATETYKYTTEKTSKFAKETKLKMKINDNKSSINKLYEKIGKIIYQKHVREENINIKEDIAEDCSKIDELATEIENCRMELLNLKERKQCPNCYKEINIEYEYCPNCGAKQEETTENNQEGLNENADNESSKGGQDIEVVEVSEEEE